MCDIKSEMDRKLVLEFFEKFSRFECALKREGFLKHQNGPAKPDWERFSETVSGGYDPQSCSKLSKAIRKIKKMAPKRQHVCDGKLCWKKPERNGRPDLPYAIDLVKIVRNNLFHGGKYPSGEVEEVARNTDLLKVSIEILEECGKLNKKIGRYLESTPSN